LKAGLFCAVLKQEVRVLQKNFTHKRKLQFSTILLLILNTVCKSLSLELQKFLSVVENRPNAEVYQKCFCKSTFGKHDTYKTHSFKINSGKYRFQSKTKN
jgi:hypothetical protein